MNLGQPNFDGEDDGNLVLYERSCKEMTEPVSEQPVLSAKLIELERIAPNSERVEHSYKRGEVFLIEENPYQEEEEEEDSSEESV